MAASVALRRVSKTFSNSVRAVDALDLEVDSGEFLTLLGPSGSGKTTVLRILAGLEEVDSGSVLIAGEDVTEIPPYNRHLGLVSQRYDLFPHMTVAENIRFGLQMRKDTKNADLRIATVLEMVELPGYEGRHPHQLSGGQQQRVALARALVTQPRVLLMDEPFGALDKQLRDQLQIEIRQLQNDLQITTVFVTHDQHEALAMSDRVAIMRDGRMEQLDTPSSIYRHPSNRFVAGFVGTMNFIDCIVVGPSGDDWMIEVAGQRLAARDHRNPISPGVAEVAIRPEDLRLHRETTSGGLRAVIRDFIYQGESIRVLVNVGDSKTYTVWMSPSVFEKQRWTRGDSVMLSWDPPAAHIFQTTEHDSSTDPKGIDDS